MAFLKAQWFKLVNSLVLAGAIAFYAFSIMPTGWQNEELKKKIASGVGEFRGLMQKKPTAVWDEELGKSRQALDAQNKAIKEDLKKADLLVESFFSLGDDSTIETPPEVQRLSEYKEKLLQKWIALEERYTAATDLAQTGGGIPVEMGNRPGLPVPGLNPMDLDLAAAPDAKKDEEKKTYPFLCKRDILRSLQPAWLREAVPLNIFMIKDAQKTYWIAEHVFSILEGAGLSQLSELKIQDDHREANAEQGAVPFWTARDLELEVLIPHAQIRALLQKIHDSPMLLRLTGLSQQDLAAPPKGVECNVPFVSFRENSPVGLKLFLRHYDLINAADLESQKGREAARGGRGGRGG